MQAPETATFVQIRILLRGKNKIKDCEERQEGTLKNKYDETEQADTFVKDIVML